MAMMASTMRALRARSPAIALVEAWWKARGLPLEMLYVPTHLVRFANLYANPNVWPSLYGLQHDEKDVFALKGPKQGPLQD